MDSRQSATCVNHILPHINHHDRTEEKTTSYSQTTTNQHHAKVSNCSSILIPSNVNSTHSAITIMIAPPFIPGFYDAKPLEVHQNNSYNEGSQSYREHLPNNTTVGYPHNMNMNIKNYDNCNKKEGMENTLNTVMETQNSIQPRTRLKKIKRNRTAFLEFQIKALEKEFGKNHFIDRNRRQELSKILNIPDRTIKIWFQNRRMKVKKDKADMEELDDDDSLDSYVPNSEAYQAHNEKKGSSHCSHNQNPSSHSSVLGYPLFDKTFHLYNQLQEPLARLQDRSNYEHSTNCSSTPIRIKSLNS